MSSTDADPFDAGVERDGWGRPLIIPTRRDGAPSLTAKRKGYTRASTFAKALDDGQGLTRWKVRHAAVGIANNPDLAALIAAKGRDLNTYSDTDKREIDEVLERAHDRSGGNMKADYGTTVHTLTEPGRDPFGFDCDDEPFSSMTRDVAAYERLLEALDVEVIATETFVVNDELHVAGTFDHLYRFRSDLTAEDGTVLIAANTVLVVDKKTGRLELGQHAIQLATYARGSVYDHHTGVRTMHGGSIERGLVVHVPKGTGTASAYVVDLGAGWEDAKLAAKVRQARARGGKLGKLALAVTVDDVEPDPSTPAPAAPAPVEVVTVRPEPEPTKAEPEPTKAEPAVDEPAPIAEYIAAVKADVEALAAATAIPERFVDEPAAELGVGDAMANLARAGLAPVDAILAQIQAVTSRDAGLDLWRKYAQRGAWTDAHNAAMKARLAALATAA